MPRSASLLVLPVLVAAPLLLHQEAAPSLVDQADPANTIAASSQPGLGDLAPQSETFFVDEAKGRVGIGKTNPDTKLHVTGNMRITWNGQVNEGIGSGSLQMTNMGYSRGWSGDPFGFQPYGGPLELDRLNTFGVDASDSLFVRPGGKVGIGVENPVMQLDVDGVVRTTDTIVSTKPAGAPFIVASDDVTANLNADLLDGRHADDFALKTDLQGGGTTLLAVAEESPVGPSGIDLLAKDPWQTPHAGTGVVFADGTAMGSAGEPRLPVAPGPIGTVTAAHGDLPSPIYGFAMELVRMDSVFDAELPSSSGDDIGPTSLEIADNAGGIVLRLLKPVDQTSMLLYQNLHSYRGSIVEGDGGVASPGDDDITGALSIRLDQVPLYEEKGEPAPTWVDLELVLPRVYSIRHREVRPGDTIYNKLGTPDTDHHALDNGSGLMEEVVIAALRVNVSWDGAASPMPVGSPWFVSLGDAATPQAYEDYELILRQGLAMGHKPGAPKPAEVRSIDWDFSHDDFVPAVGQYGTPKKTVDGFELDLYRFVPQLLGAGQWSGVDGGPSHEGEIGRISIERSGPGLSLAYDLRSAYVTRWSARSDAAGLMHFECQLAYEELTMEPLKGQAGNGLPTATISDESFTWQD